MIGTQDLTRYLKWARSCEYSQGEDKEYRAEIVARLKSYDKLCHDLKQLISTLSNGVDTK